jgi:ADP-heptose:LPS heptosyltransferase
LQRILSITLSNIGDVQLAMPALERPHQYYPEVMIDILTDARAQNTLEHHPNRGAIFLKEKRGGRLEDIANAAGTPTLTVFVQRRPLRYHPRGPQRAWIVAEDENLDSLSAHSVAERLHTLLKASANVRRT